MLVDRIYAGAEQCGMTIVEFRGDFLDTDRFDWGRCLRARPFGYMLIEESVAGRCIP